MDETMNLSNQKSTNAIDAYVHRLRETEFLLEKLEQTLQLINAQPNQPAGWQTKQKIIVKNLAWLRKAIRNYYQVNFVNCREDSNHFWSGYNLGKKYGRVLYDVEKSEVKALKQALKLDFKNGFIYPFLFGMKVGWRLARLERNLARFSPRKNGLLQVMN